MKVNGVEVKDEDNPTIDELIEVLASAEHTLSTEANAVGWHLYHTSKVMLEHIKRTEHKQGIRK